MSYVNMEVVVAMDIGYLTGLAQKTNFAVQPGAAVTREVEQYSPEVTPTFLPARVRMDEKFDRRKKKASWIVPVIMEGIEEIKKDQGISAEAPVFVERRHIMKAVPAERRKDRQRCTVQAADAKDMNDFRKAERTNKVGEYYLQKNVKAVASMGESFSLQA